MRVICALLERTEFLRPFAESCGALSSKVATGDGVVFLVLDRRKKLSEKEICEKLEALGKIFGTRLRFGFSSNPSDALAFARTGLKRKKDLPPHTLPCFFDPFASRDLAWEKYLNQLPFLRITEIDHALLRFSLDEEQVARGDAVSALHLWGAETGRPRGGRAGLEASEMNSRETSAKKLLAASPRNDRIVHRWRDDTLLSLQRWASPAALPWPKFIPDDPLQELIGFAAGDDQALHRGLSRLLARVQGRGRYLLRLQVEVNGLAKELLVSRAQNTESLFFPLVRALLSPEAPFYTLNLRVVESLPGIDAPEAEKEAWKSLAGLLHSRLGVDRPCLPTRGIVRPGQLHPEQGNLFPLSPRPLALLRRPEPIEVKGQNFVRQGGAASAVMVLEGPAKVDGEWWFSERERNYYRAKLTSGEEWWVYATAQREIFLHGILE